MPIRFRSRKRRRNTTKRRVVKRRRGRSIRKLKVRKFPLGRKTLAKLLYFDRNYALNPAGTGALAVHVFSANGVYDPDVTGTGHQPRGFDQIMSMFDHYTVIKSYLTVSITSQSATANRYIFGVAICDTPAAKLDVRDYIEGYGAKWTPLYAGSIHGGGKILKIQCTPHRYLGRSKPLSDPELKGSIGGNPSEQVFYHVFLVDEGTADPPSCAFSAKMTFYTVFHEPKNPAIS